MSLPADPPELDRQVIARVLTDPDTLTRADLPHIQGWGLSGAVRAALAPDHPLRAALRPQMLDLALRHAHIKREVQPLIHAWANAGIPALLMKGFALAEFEYATPGERFYGDIDVLLPEDWDTVIRAAQIALACGWRSDHLDANPELWTHETMHLFSPGGNVRMDVHRFVAAQRSGASTAFLRNLTAGVWKRAVKLDWDGMAVYRAHPLDAAVVNVALGRSWGDMHGLKPADYLDVQRVMHHHFLSLDNLDAHAARLGVSPTWEAFKRCVNPGVRTLNLDIAQTTVILWEGRGRQGLKPRRYTLITKTRAVRRLFPYLLPTLGHVIAAWWAMRQPGDPRQHLKRWTPNAPTRRLPWFELVNNISAISAWTRLLYPKQRKLGVCVPRAYATYRALRGKHHPAVFVSGVARQAGSITGHAWVEDDRGIIDAYGEPFNRQRFKPVFSYPANPEPPQ